MAFRNPVTRLSQLVADSITGGTITGATIKGGTIVGAIIKTLSGGTITGTSLFGSLFSTGQSATDTNPRIEIHDNTHGNDIEFHSTNPNEYTPAKIYSTGDASTVGALRLDSGTTSASDAGSSWVGIYDAGGIVLDAGADVDLIPRPLNKVSAQGPLRIGVPFSPQPGLKTQPGSDINGLDFGYAQGNADGNGQLTVGHNLNAVPAAVALGHVGPGGGQSRVVAGSRTATTFQIEFSDKTGTTVASGTSVNAFWIATA